MPGDYTAQLPMCVYCQKAVEPESAWIDETGKTVHAKCYLLALRREQAAAPPFER
jgi:hypothetical protein